MTRFALSLFAALALTACASTDGAGPEAVMPRVEAWRSLATSSDRERVRDWRQAWVRGLAKARAAGHGAEIGVEGALLEPDAALPGAALPVGDYLCRTIKVGSKSAGPLNHDGLLDYIAYQPFSCRVGGGDGSGVQSFVKLTGSQRPIGRLFPENDRRVMFLGTLQLGDEQGVLRYGHDRERDMIGVVERIGERRWRLVLPYPHFESTVDVLELVPKP